MALQFIEPQHIDINPQLMKKDFLKFAKSTLEKINLFRAPQDKCKVLINFCNIISKMIIDSNTAKPAGADEVIPVITYCLLKFNINKFISNLNYIRNFRHKMRLGSQEDYFLTAIESATDFL